MNTNRQVSLPQLAAWAIVIGGHVLLIALVLSARPQAVQPAESDSKKRTVLFFVELPPPVTARTPVLAPKPVRQGAARAREEASPDTSIHVPVDAGAGDTPPINWHDEAERSARAAMGEALKYEKRNCDNGDPPNPLLPRCPKPVPPPKWEPEPKKAGFIGPLPYVRIGDCIVGLGFIGCSKDKPNGDLFKDMNNPDRDRSSVPDVDTINKGIGK